MTKSKALKEVVARVEEGKIKLAPFWKVWRPENEDAILAYTAKQAANGSLDAAKALHEAVLPEFGWSCGPWGARVWLCSKSPHMHTRIRKEEELTDNPARAWLLAIIHALIAQEEDKA